MLINFVDANNDANHYTKLPNEQIRLTATGHIENFAIVEQNDLSRPVSGGGMERNRRRVDGLSTDFDLELHQLAAAAGPD